MSRPVQHICGLFKGVSAIDSVVIRFSTVHLRQFLVNIHTRFEVVA